MIDRRDNVKIVRARARRIATEEDFGAILLKSVVKGVEDFGRNKFPRHENIGSFERLRLQHRHLPYLSLSPLLSLSLTE